MSYLNVAGAVVENCGQDLMKAACCCYKCIKPADTWYRRAFQMAAADRAAVIF